MAILTRCYVLALFLMICMYPETEGALSGTVAAGTCVCATTNVNARESGTTSAAIVDVMNNGECGETLGGMNDANGYTWYQLEFDGQFVWVAGNFLNSSPASSCYGTMSGAVEAGTCVCATTNVNARASGTTSASIVTVIQNGECGATNGGMGNSDGYTWYELVFEGQVVWVAGNFINTAPTSTCTVPCPAIVTRSEWNARAPTSVSYLSGAVGYTFIHHAASDPCFNQADCSSKCRAFQNYHMDTKGWSDIGYSFLIGGDGSVYEGRGWDRTGAHTYGYNSISLGFCFIGDFTSADPTSVQIASAQRLIACGVDLGKVLPNYILEGHRDVSTSSCPGQKLYDIITGWSHYA